jgi:hypothetical protein
VEQKIDEGVPRRRLIVVLGVGLRLVRPADRGDFLAQPGDLRLERPRPSSEAMRAASAASSALARAAWSARSFSICATVLAPIVSVFSSLPGSKASPAGGCAPLA